MPQTNSLPTGDQIALFQKDGAICLRGVFKPLEVSALQEAVDVAIRNPGPYALNFSSNDGAGFFGDVFVWTRNPAFRNIVVLSHLGEIAGRFLGSQKTRFIFDHLLVKEPGASEVTPWHQDAAYFPIEGEDCCSIWIALDHVSSENGAVEYLRRSHTTGKVYAPKSFHGDNRLSNEMLEEVPDVEAHRVDYDIATWELFPGDCVAHHVRTLHGAPGNSSPSIRRRGLSTRWIGDDIVYGTRLGIPEPMTKSLEDLAPELELGKPFDHPMFPLVWQSETAQ